MLFLATGTGEAPHNYMLWELLRRGHTGRILSACCVRYRRDLGNGFGFTVYADFGGFGVGAHTDWQIFGTIDYALSPRAALRLGYLSLNFNYTASDNLGFNVHMKGPILAATFRF